MDTTSSRSKRLDDSGFPVGSMSTELAPPSVCMDLDYQIQEPEPANSLRKHDAQEPESEGDNTPMSDRADRTEGQANPKT